MTALTTPLMPPPQTTVTPGREVRDVMTPGVVTIVEDASLKQVCRAFRRHSVHAVLVVGRSQGVPIGWVTARGILGLLDRDPALFTARDAVVERAVSIEPSALVPTAVAMLSREGISHLLVSNPGSLPEGVVSDMDIALGAA